MVHGGSGGFTLVCAPDRDGVVIEMSAWLSEERERIDWHTKAFGPAQQGRTVAELVSDGTTVTDLPTPLLTLDAAAVEHNVALMRGFTDAHGVDLAPHGKTTMSPALWHRQLAAGAWAITVATPWQLRVAVAAGVRRILHAGAILSAADLAHLGALRSADPDLEVLVWADSPETVALTSAGYPSDGPPLPVLVERGGPGARTGARTLAESLATARAVHHAPNLAVAGVAGWEGSLRGAGGPGGRSLVAAFCDGVAETFNAVADAGLFDTRARPVITTGGSSYFDIVVDRWAPLLTRIDLRPRIVLRSGCYLTHDDGAYRRSSPFALTNGPQLRAALHAWAQVVSRPEPGLALLNAGRRDMPYDGDLPVPQLIRGRDAASSARALAGARISQLNDQHAYLEIDPSSDLRIGEVVRCGISHPCTAFDKWTVLPVVANAHVDEPRLIGMVRTVF
jgi:D-serine deaminase-like pyridoxal phosphate-dependent protein